MVLLDKHFALEDKWHELAHCEQHSSTQTSPPLCVGDETFEPIRRGNFCVRFKCDEPEFQSLARAGPGRLKGSSGFLAAIIPMLCTACPMATVHDSLKQE